MTRAEFIQRAVLAQIHQLEDGKAFDMGCAIENAIDLADALQDYGTEGVDEEDYSIAPWSGMHVAGGPR